ncbi:MBL fold metallo-hydrolase [Chloroflexota bacterium]
MNEVVPGIHQLQIDIPNSPLGHTNSYLVRREDDYLLIDTGWNSEEAFKSLKEQLDEVGTDIRNIGQIIITHVHPDHYGLVSRFIEKSMVNISLHKLEKDIVDFRYPKMNEYLRQVQQWLQANGIPNDLLSIMLTTPPGGKRVPFSSGPNVTILQEGEIVRAGVFNFQVLWTPGHSPGHICLYEQTNRILFSGDHVIPGITPNISLATPSGVNPLRDFFNSLERIKVLDVNLVLPGHAQPFTDLSTAIEEVLQHHEFRIGEMLQALVTQPKTAYEVSTEMTWMLDEGGTRFHNLTPWDKIMAITEALAHLEAMRIEGRLDKYMSDNVIYYHIA